ncbi:MAG TPA: WD40 repeat domain-containing protein, partial [bacterium]
QYIRHVNGKFEGKIFCGIGSHAQIVEYDLATGNKTAFLPEQYQKRSFVYYSDRFKDLLYAVVVPEPVILFFDPMTHQLLREVHPPKDNQDFALFNYESIVDVGDDLYFGTRPDDNLYAYNYDRDETRLIAEGIGSAFGLAQDRYLFCRNYFGTYSIFDLKEKKIVLQRDTKFEGAGMDIFALAEGVDGTVVGSSYINQGFFSYDPKNNELTPFGASVQFGGQIRQLVAFKNKIFLAHYTHARLTEYDPNAPWNPGNQSDSNPRLIGAVGQEQDRFPAAYLAEDDKTYFGTQPEYGVFGGTLTIFDPETRQFDVHRNVVQDQSVFALTGNRKGLIFGGTAIAGGLGAHPTQKEAKFFIWDMAKKGKLMERTIIPDAAEIWDLVWTPENKLIGAADSFLFVYDIKRDEVEATRNVHSGVILNVLASQDGWCYGNSEKLFFRFSKDLQQFEAIDQRPSPPQFGRGLIETSNGRIYLGIGAVLYELVRVK